MVESVNSQEDGLDKRTPVAFLRAVQVAERDIDREINRLLSTDALGMRAKGYWGAISQGCDLLGAVASCRYGCLSSNHEVENVVRRLTKSVLASLLLVRSGYVDESLSILRTAAEHLNLLQLFSVDKDALGKWALADNLSRRKEFSPIKVRLKLESETETPEYSETAYAALCTPYVHAVPLKEQQAHSLSAGSKFYVGPIHPVPGIACVFTEAGYCIARALPRVEQLFQLPAVHLESSQRIVQALVLLAGKGEMRAENYPGTLADRTWEVEGTDSDPSGGSE